MIFSKVCCLGLLVSLAVVQAADHVCKVYKDADKLDTTFLECPKFKIELTPWYFKQRDRHFTTLLKVDCTGNPDFQLLQNLPNIPNYKFHELYYLNCPLHLGNLSLVELLSTILDLDRLSATTKLSLVSLTNPTRPMPLNPHLFYGLNNLENLEILLKKNIPLENPLLFQHLSKLKSLKLWGNTIFNSAIFLPLVVLEEFTVGVRSTISLSNGLFSNLASLNRLYLIKNKLQHIEQIPALSKLLYLNITSNQLVALQDNAFDRLPSLTELYLDSNNLTSLPTGLLKHNAKLKYFGADNQHGAGLQLEDELFAGLGMLQAVSLSGCNIDKLPEQLFIGTTALTRVNLSNNKLKTLPKKLFFYSSNLQELCLHDNLIIDVFPDTLLLVSKHLRILHLSYNNLTSLSKQFLESLGALQQLHLSANPWKCDCDNPLLIFAVQNAALITDFSTLQCSNGQPINSAGFMDRCSWTGLIELYISVAVSLVIIISLLGAGLYIRYSLEIKVWLFTHNWLQWLVAEEQIDTDKRYDAFMSYSHKDEDFITKELLPWLQSEDLNFTICWHVRDFMPGDMISSQITKAIEESRRTIIVLSPHYLESVWGQIEFNTAYLQSLKDKRNRVIPIIYQDIGSVENLNPELAAYLKTNTYVRCDDPWFWDKLQYAMPHKLRSKRQKATSNVQVTFHADPP